MIERWSSTGERERFDQDAEGRTLRRWSMTASGPAVEEAYRYEGIGRLFEAAGPAREYGPGGVLRSRGEERYFQDGEGRRVEKVRRVKVDVDPAGGSGTFGDGAILATMRATVWGFVATDPRATARTPLRFPGQYADEETGLHFNRYRFYDPEAGLYISPDPVGLQGGLGAYEYARGRPLRVVDPDGLAPTTCVVVGSAGTTTATSNQPAEIHPVVQAAMPKEANGKFPSFEPPRPKKNGQPGRNSDDPPPGRRPDICAEPGALSDHIRRWEGQNGGPLDPADKPRVAACLGSISSITATQNGATGEPETRAPCANCSQMLASLNDTHGHPRPGVITPGATSRGGSDRVNFTQPHPAWPGSPYKPYHGYPKP